MKISPLSSLNQNAYYSNNNSRQSSDTDKNQQKAKETQNKQQITEEYIASDRLNMDYNPNDTSLSVTFADKNTKTVPTAHINKDTINNAVYTKTHSTIHTDENGTRFLVISTMFGNQAFQKSIKLSDNI